MIERKNEARLFYDIHCHAFNLSHPNLISFIKSYVRDSKFFLPVISAVIAALVPLIIASCFYPWLQHVLLSLFGIFCISLLAVMFFIYISPDKWGGIIFRYLIAKFKRPFNLLALMENDLGSYFILAENDLWEGVFKKGAGKLVIADKAYDKIILTPLMMDYGDKKIIDDSLPYGKKSISKPIAEQVTDLFNGIKDYLGQSNLRLFEIYPFLGINTKNYSHAKVEMLLAKYFGDYKRDRQSLYANMGKFTGDIEDMNSNFFAGIKVYPPLGFDPWPDYDTTELAKVECLYRYCSDMQIPMTAHCSDGGFITDSLFNAFRRTSPDRWEMVLNKYPDLILNLAHMGKQANPFSRVRNTFSTNRRWIDKVFELIARYENVYTDFSCLGFDSSYYRDLKDQIKTKSIELSEILKGKEYTLRDKILFGSDFMINLLWIDSYNDYLGRFIDEQNALADDRHFFCSSNPEKFLFGQKPISVKPINNI